MFTTLRAKLFAGFLLILLLLLALGGYSIFSFRSLEEITSSGLDQNSESILANLSMYESIVRMNAAQLRLLAGEGSEAHAVFDDEKSQFYQALERARRSAALSESELRIRVEALLNDLDIAWADYQTHLPVFEALAKRDPAKARALYNSTLSPEFDNLKNINLELSSFNVLAFRSGKSNVIARARNATVGVLIVTLVALLIGAIGSFVIARRTTRPLRALTDSLKGLEAGHLDARITVESADEIGDLAFEFNRLAERLRVFEALNVNEIVREKQKSEAIIESIDDPLLLFDADGQLTLMNHAAEDITGLMEQAARGRALRQLFRDKRLLKEVETAIEHAAAIPQEEQSSPPIVSIMRKDRQRYFRLRVARIVYRSTSTPAEIETSTKIWVLVFFTDITHFKELDKLKSDFIAKVSHEFRTPLTSMTMALDILHAEMLGKMNIEQHDIVNTSRADAERLAKLIKDLLHLSRLESARQSALAASSTTQLHESLSQLVRSLTPMYRDKQLTLDYEPSEEVVLRMPEEHLTSITTNLLSNALMHTPAAGTVTLHSEYDHERATLVITISDTGIGIATEDQNRIFEKFVQVKPTDSSTPGSVGLGLAIVTEIAARYQGKIELQSAIGEGSTFTVKLIVPEVVPVEVNGETDLFDASA